jgi:hypothetical protein
MEANQTTCPQCGLVNNHLAEACAQCGLIFVKNKSVENSQNLRDEQKRKAIEEAEAILDQTLPSPETDAFGNDIVKKIEMSEDTVEMQIPVETAAGIPEKPKLEENQDTETHEIEMEAIEAPAESPAGTIDAEELFLSEITTTQTADATATETVETDADSAAEAQKPVESSDLTINLDSVKQDDPDHKEVDTAVKQPKTGPAAKIPMQRNSEEDKADKTKYESAEQIKTQSPAGEVTEPADTKVNAAAEAGPAGQKMRFEKKQQQPVGWEEAVQSAAQIQPEATIEMPKEPKEPEEAQVKQKQVQVLETLKRQREKQAEAEASNKEHEAQANEKKKLAMAKAEALKKQKAAQARAEALEKQKAARAKALALKKQRANQARLEVLKKQKEAQAKAEASAQEAEVASAGIMPAASKGSAGNHEKLLGLLKRYKGKAIGINYDNSAEIKEAELIDANEEFFSIRVKDKKLQYSYPLKTILAIVEGQEGVETGDKHQKTKFDAVIKVYPLVLFK